MKFTIYLLVFITGSLQFSNVCNAESPHDQLKQLVEQLQQNPSDSALREKIIKLAPTLKPELALPSEAERRMVRGGAAFKSATSAAGYQDAAQEFEQATLAAPWYSDAYFNLGVAQDKAGNHEAALRSLKFAQMASPNSKEITTLIYEVEFRQEKANSPEARAAREVARTLEAEARFLASLEGTKYICVQLWDYYGYVEQIWTVAIEKGKIYGYGDTIRSTLANQPVGFKAAWFDLDLKGRVSQGVSWGRPVRVDIFDSYLTVKGTDSPPTPAPLYEVTCRRQ